MLSALSCRADGSVTQSTADSRARAVLVSKRVLKGEAAAAACRHNATGGRPRGSMGAFIGGCVGADLGRSMGA